MKTVFKVTLLASLFFVSLPFVQAQKDVKEASVGYEITDVNSESMEAQMMKGTLINIDYNQAKTKLNVQMMGGLVVMDIFMETATETSTMLMNMMGKKAKVIQEKQEEADSLKSDFDIVYDKSDSKEILGNKCIKATLTEKSSGQKFVMYVAKKLKAKTKFVEELFPGLEGFPLEIVIEQDGMGFTITAQNFEKSVSKDAFVIPDGYPEMTPEEFAKEMGGMGNLGF